MTILALQRVCCDSSLEMYMLVHAGLLQPSAPNRQSRADIVKDHQVQSDLSLGEAKAQFGSGE